jgi:hypothetical protein
VYVPYTADGVPSREENAGTPRSVPGGTDDDDEAGPYTPERSSDGKGDGGDEEPGEGEQDEGYYGGDSKMDT